MTWLSNDQAQGEVIKPIGCTLKVTLSQSVEGYIHYVRSHVSSLPTYFLIVSLVAVQENFRLGFSAPLVITCVSFPFIMKLSMIAFSAALVTEIATELPKELNFMVEDAKFASSQSILRSSDPLCLLPVLAFVYLCYQIVFELIFRVARIVLSFASVRKISNELFSSGGIIFQSVFFLISLTLWPSVAAALSILLSLLFISYCCPLELSIITDLMEVIKKTLASFFSSPKCERTNFKAALTECCVQFKIAKKRSNIVKNYDKLFYLRLIEQGLTFSTFLSVPNFAFLFAVYKDFRIGLINYINEDPTLYQALSCCATYFVSVAFVKLSECKTCGIKLMLVETLQPVKIDEYFVKWAKVIFFMGVVVCFSAYLFRYHAAIIFVANLYLFQFYLFIMQGTNLQTRHPGPSAAKTGHLKQA